MIRSNVPPFTFSQSVVCGLHPHLPVQHADPTFPACDVCETPKIIFGILVYISICPILSFLRLSLWMQEWGIILHHSLITTDPRSALFRYTRIPWWVAWNARSIYSGIMPHKIPRRCLKLRVMPNLIYTSGFQFTWNENAGRGTEVAQPGVLESCQVVLNHKVQRSTSWIQSVWYVRSLGIPM